MKNNKNVRKDNLSPVDNSTKRVYKMYKSKKNWVVAPVVLLTLLGAVAPAPIALSNVVNAETTEDLAAKREDAQAKVADLVQFGLTKAGVEKFQSQIASASSNFDTIVENARVEAASNQVTAFNTAKTDALNAISEQKLPNLPTSAVNDLVSKVQAINVSTYSNADTTLKTSKSLATFVSDVTTKKSQLSVLKAYATELNNAFSSFASAKTYATSKINSLAFVNEAYKADKVSKLDTYTNTSDWKQGVYGLLTEALGEDMLQKSALVNEVRTLVNRVFTATDAETLATKNAYISRAEAAKTPAEINTIISEIKAKEFEINKKQFEQDVKGLDGYTSSERQALKDYFLGELANVKDQNALDALKANFNEVNAQASTADLKTYVGGKIGTVTPNTGLVNLGFSNPVKKADSLRTISRSNSALEVAKLYFSLKAEDAQILADAKEKATADINGLESLSKSEKTSFVNDVKAATNAEAVVDLANEAKQLNDSRFDSEALVALKGKARDSFKLIGVQDTSAIDSIHTGDNEPAALKSVKDVVSDKVANEATSVNSVETATNLVNALLGIDSYKADILKSLEADKNDVNKLIADVQHAVETARHEAETAYKADHLALVINNAVKEVNGLKYLSAEAKDDFVKSIKAAQSESKVNELLVNARQKDTEAQRAAQELADAKSAAVTQIGELSHLSPSQAGAFVEQIRSAATIKDVHAIANKAILADIDAITDLDEYKTVVTDKLLTTDTSKALRFAELTTQQVNAHVKDVNAAKTLEDAKKAVAEAQAKNAKQNDERVTAELDQLIKDGSYSQAKVKLASLMLPENISKYTKIVDDALALREKKLAALDTIAKADYLSATEKEKLAKEVTAAKDIAEVDKVLGKVTDKAPAKAVQLYRAYNPNSGEHLYTADKAEYDHLVSLGWKAEGNAWKAADKGAPVYRLYNPNSGEHFYTISESEYNDVAKAGWKKEGVAFYSDANKGVEVYRLFNPNAKGAGSHHYTILASERDDLIKAGWKYENVAFFGLK